MKSSNRKSLAHLVEFAWSAWAELGVSGWTRHHRDWFIDPEALILLTGQLGDTDPRLRAESLDWCARYRTFLSRSRLGFLHKSWPDTPTWREYSAGLSAATGERWPGATRSRKPKLTGKSQLVLHDRPALVGLRMRAVFGATARSEVMRVLLLAGPGDALTAADVAEEAGYTKRNVAEALAGLTTAGLVATTKLRNTIRYDIEKRDTLTELFGPLPSERASFAALCRGLWVLTSSLERARAATPAARSVEARHALSSVLQDLHRAGLTPRLPPSGSDAWQPIERWTLGTVEQVARGTVDHSVAPANSRRRA